MGPESVRQNFITAASQFSESLGGEIYLVGFEREWSLLPINW